MRENLEEMMKIMNNCPLYGREGEGRIYVIAEKCIIDAINENTTSDIENIYRYVIFKQFIDNIDNVIKLCNTTLKFRSGPRIDHACFVLLWVVDVIQQCDMELFETILKMFCEDAIISNQLFSVVALRSSKEAMIDILYVNRSIYKGCS